jgi:hypothetical protein
MQNGPEIRLIKHFNIQQLGYLFDLQMRSWPGCPPLVIQLAHQFSRRALQEAKAISQ